MAGFKSGIQSDAAEGVIREDDWMGVSITAISFKCIASRIGYAPEKETRRVDAVIACADE